MKCSFCEEVLVCKFCDKPFRPRQGETLVAAYQPDMAINCPECQRTLACRWCGFVYGGEEEDE